MCSLLFRQLTEQEKYEPVKEVDLPQDRYQDGRTRRRYVYIYKLVPKNGCHAVETIRRPQGTFSSYHARSYPKIPNYLGGADLFAANHVVFLEPYGQPAAAQQASERAHRRGQTETIIIYRITCAGKNGIFAEEHVLEKANARELLSTSVFKKAKVKGLEVENDEVPSLGYRTHSRRLNCR